MPQARKKNFKAVYYASGIFIVALIAIQLYWVITSLHLQASGVEHALKSSLEEISKQVEDEAYCQTFYSRTYLRQNEGLFALKTPYKKEAQSDTIDKYFISAADEHSYLHKKLYPVDDPAAVDITIKLRFFRSNPHMNWKDTIPYGEGNVAVHPSHVRDIIDLHLLDSLVKHALYLNHVDTVYYLGLKQEGKPSYDQMLGNDRMKNGNCVKTTFLKGNTYRPYELTLWYASPFKGVIASMWTTLALSVLIVLGLVFFYFYFVHSIISAEKLSEMKNVFINNTTHEFKTPITNINLAVDNWRAVKSNHDFYMNIIDEENKNLEYKVEQILELAALEKMNDAPATELVDVHCLLEEVSQAFRIQLENIGASINYDLRAPYATIRANRQHIRNLIHNLVDNAIKYRSKHLVITLASVNRNNQLVISITDNGIGIKAQSLQQIFEKFHRENTGDVHNVKGFGLGLSYVKFIVSLYHASIDVKSREGHGSTFTICFNLPA